MSGFEVILPRARVGATKKVKKISMFHNLNNGIAGRPVERVAGICRVVEGLWILRGFGWGKGAQVRAFLVLGLVRPTRLCLR